VDWLAGIAAPLLTFVLGLVLRPWVDAQVRRGQRGEKWQEKLETLSADLSGLLWRRFTRNRGEPVHATAYAEWEGGLQREVVLAARFAPNKTHRDACHKVWVEFEKLIRRVHALDRTPANSSRLSTAHERYEQAFGETSYALDQLVEALGGPKAVARAEYPLPLRSEDDGEDDEEAE
jgi:hypothetical protein